MLHREFIKDLHLGLERGILHRFHRRSDTQRRLHDFGSLTLGAAGDDAGGEGSSE